MLFQALPWCEGVGGFKVHFLNCPIVPLLISDTAFFPSLLLWNVFGIIWTEMRFKPYTQRWLHNISDRKVLPHIGELWWIAVNRGKSGVVICVLRSAIFCPHIFLLRRLHKAQLDKIFLVAALVWVIPNTQYLNLNREKMYLPPPSSVDKPFTHRAKICFHFFIHIK